MYRHNNVWVLEKKLFYINVYDSNIKDKAYKPSTTISARSLPMEILKEKKEKSSN